MEKSNILMLVFSSRKNGNCDIASKIFIKSFSNTPFSLEIIDVTKLNHKACTGCFGCNNSGFRCVMSDDLELIKNKIASANAVITVAPCFIFSTPARMKIIMDRLAAWALNNIENGEIRKIGVGVNFAGAPKEWHSFQRSSGSLFLSLFNCDIKYIKTFDGIGLKGEILLHPNILEEIKNIAESLKSAMQNRDIVFPSDIEDKKLLLCPCCHGDAFRVYNRKNYICISCGTELHPSVLSGKSKVMGLNKLSPAGAAEHTSYIGGKIANSFSVTEDITKRLTFFEKNGTFDKTVYKQKEEEINKVQIEWETDGLEEFRRVVPKGFQNFVKRAIEKKAIEQGITIITKDVFLSFKKNAVG